MFLGLKTELGVWKHVDGQALSFTEFHGTKGTVANMQCLVDDKLLSA